MEALVENRWLVALIVVLPFLSFLACVFIGNRMPRRDPNAGVMAVVLVGIAALIALLTAAGIFLKAHHAGEDFNGISGIWYELNLGGYTLPIGYKLDTLTAMMLIVVGFVGWLIHVYSIGYMHGDPRFPRFFAFLSLFMASMFLLVLASSLVVLYVAWELVGLCSYLLIGFWFEKPEAAKAAKKAFIVTRCGDAFFAIGIFLLFMLSGKLTFDDVFAAAQSPSAPTFPLSQFPTHSLYLLAALFLFGGAVGKSAQFPLHVWLPDAMEGPTPVSALIHAATMVAAGVYMVARLYPLFALAGVEGSYPLLVVAYIGGFTAFLAATLAVVERDIKRILAYSTISQLGYMMLGLGVGGYTAGTFHLFTHAFFKALLFLGSGSVIHAMHTNDIFEMGGLKKHMPTTWWTYMAGYLALAGIPPLSGFWSKDEILAHAFHHQPILFWLGVLTAFLTAFYMTRQVCLVFYGETRSHHAHPHESPKVMTIPLIILAIGSIFVGLVGTPWNNVYHHFIHYGEKAAEGFSLPVAIISILAAIGGILFARSLYLRPIRPIRTPEEDPVRRLGGFYTAMVNRWYLDWYENSKVRRAFFGFMELCRRFDIGVVDGIVNAIGYGTYRIIAWAYGWFDLHVVDGIVNTIGTLTKVIGWLFKHVQTGFVQHYMFLVVVGLVIIIVVSMFR